MAAPTARTPPDHPQCDDCAGIGRVRIAEVQRHFFIFWRTVIVIDTCPSCCGTGRTPPWKARR